ncbi:Autophagy protein 5 [Phytophthora cinnamomi]|uniref:Autophagy protein 5 n=1 Tax=Phytophthora cinnamomi TaxID=4785 RepID=UPI003559563D|nr:Autophagy protein 5 [Phytophthora cinnamomi]
MATPSEAPLKQRVWAGRIPVVFSLDPNEVTTLHAPRPFYAMVPRMSYLVSQTRDVVEYFRDAAPPMSAMQGASIWFEANGRPLHWHLPFGLLRDLLGGDGAADLPWALTVHFLGFPGDVLLPCDNEQSVESHFMHSLKQATFLRMGSTKAVMALPEAQQTQIWTSISQNDYEGYREATRELHLDGGVDASALRHLPLRVHLDNAPAIQMPIAPLQNGREKTLQEVLHYLLPDLFPSDVVSDTDAHQFQLVVHGIPVPAHVSIVELYRSLSYADGFLYVAVLPEPASS